MNDQLDVQRNPDGSLTITAGQPIADMLVSAIIQLSKQLQVEYSRPENETTPSTAPARLRFGGRMKISADELAESIGVSRRTISQWQNDRLIPHYKVHRKVFFDVAEVEHALRRYRCAAIGEPRPRKRRMGRIQTA